MGLLSRRCQHSQHLCLTSVAWQQVLATNLGDSLITIKVSFNILLQDQLCAKYSGGTESNDNSQGVCRPLFSLSPLCYQLIRRMVMSNIRHLTVRWVHWDWYVLYNRVCHKFKKWISTCGPMISSCVLMLLSRTTWRKKVFTNVYLSPF